VRSLLPAPPWRSIEAVLVLLGLAFGSARAAEAPPDEPKSGWINGPVRYIASPDETKSWKGLKTDADRAKAIDEFWARRDPSPGTPENEFHAEYLEAD